MSNAKNDIQSSETQYLNNYFEENLSGKGVRDSKKRIASIDFVKGLAMIFIILAHAAFAWFDSDWRYIYGLVFAFLDILGPTLFVFLSALSVVFSIKRKKDTVSDKSIRNRVFMRGFVIIIIGILFNPLSLQTSGVAYPFPLNLWGWNVLMFIGFSQILSYYSLRFSKFTRAVTGVFIIFISPFIRELLYAFKDDNVGIWILHFIITSPLPQVPILPFLSTCFLSTIFGELLYEAMISGTTEAYKKLFKTFMRWGGVLVIIGLATGLRLINVAPDDNYIYIPFLSNYVVKSEYLHIDLLRIANQQEGLPVQLRTVFPGMFDFMVRGTASNMLYSLGAALLIIGVSFYYIDIKKRNSDVIKMVNFYGKTSLSLFLIQYLFLPLYLGSFSIMFYPLMFCGYAAFLGFLMYIWTKYFDGVGSPEWLMGQLGKRGKKTE
ncbi:MAG: heparan-alpha-glucosaminide N-acetyltransferase domain-containing protein [Promethearchaeota archaeon]